jgi:hypothetical protein
MEDAILLERLGWSPTLDEINNCSERLLSYYLIFKAVVDIYKYGGTLNF